MGRISGWFLLMKLCMCVGYLFIAKHTTDLEWVTGHGRVPRQVGQRKIKYLPSQTVVRACCGHSQQGFPGM